MNVEQWKAEAKTNLTRLAQSVRQMTPGMIYGALSCAVLLPVIEAARQTDSYVGPLLALGNVFAGFGGDLIANRLQAWHDSSERDMAADFGNESRN